MRRIVAPLLAGALLISACTPAAPAPAPTTAPATSKPAAPAATTAPAATSASAAPAASPAASGSPAAKPAASPSAAAAAISAAAAKPTLPPTGTQEITVNMLQGEPDNIDPNRSSFATEGAVIQQVFEPLLTFDKALQPTAAAATKWEVSPDGKTYTFHLDPNGKFSDGVPVKAQDFVYSYKRILDPKTAAEYATFFVDAGIVGAKDFNSGKTPNADQVGVRAKDDLTVEIQLEAPLGYFPNIVALWVVPPIRQDIVEKAGDSWTQDPSTYIGNGPFKMSEWVHQDHITFVPNPNYAGTKPVLQKMTFLMVSDVTADYAAYRNNERDWTLVPDSEVNAVRNDANMSKEAREFVELTTFWIHINNTRKPLDNPLVRQAFSRAIDRNALIRDIAGGVGQPATSLIPPGMPGYEPDLGKNISFDPAAAKQLLQQAGYSDPSQFPTVTFRFATNSANQRRAEFLQAQLKQNLGINIQLESMETKAYQAAYKDKDYDIAYGGWGADYPDPQNFLSGQFTCNNSNNKWNYCSQEFDAVAQKADTGTDQAQRMQLYKQAQEILLKDMPVVPLFYRGRMVVVKPWVQNLTITAKDQYPGSRFLPEVSLVKR